VVRFSDVSSAVAYVLVAGIIGVLLWGFKHKITSITQERKMKLNNEQMSSKKEDKPKIISRKTIKIRLDEYDEIKVNLKRGEIITGKISSDGFVSIYFLTESSYRSFKNNYNFNMLDGEDDVTNYEPSFEVSRKGTYYIVFENSDKKNIVVTIDLMLNNSN